MKILVIGDFHGKFPVKLKKIAKEVDVIFCIGDFGGSDKLLKIIFKYLANEKPWWQVVGKKKAREYVMEDYNSGIKIINELNKLGKPVYTIAGNWDFTNKKYSERYGGLKFGKYQDLIKKLKNVKWWNRGKKKINELKILAFGGTVTPWIHVKKNLLHKKVHKKAVKENKKEIKQIMKHGANDIDIVLAHYPPYGFFDKIKFKGYNPMNGKLIGFKGYT